MELDESAPAIGEGPTKVISVSLPEGTLAALRAEAGSRGVSAFITAAVEQRLRDIATRAYLAEIEAEHGPFAPEELKAAAAVWAEAEAREIRWREAS